MIKTLRKTLLVSVPLALLATPSHASDASASDTQPDLFRALGDFVLGGLGPARTMEDIQREEREARAQALAGQRQQEEMADKDKTEKSAAAPADTTAIGKPVPPHADVSATAPLPAQAAPAVKLAKVEPAKSLPGDVTATDSKPATAVVPVALPADVIPPPPKARPHQEARVLPAAPAVPAEPLKSHIAATASVDQALKLGGAARIYQRRLVVD